MLRALREFGYPDARADNVLTTYLFARFFRSALEDLLEARPITKDVIEPMLAEIDALEPPQ